MDGEKQVIKIFGSAFKKMSNKHDTEKQAIQLALKLDEHDHNAFLIDVWLNNVNSPDRSDLSPAKVLNFMDYNLLQVFGFGSKIALAISSIAQERDIDPESVRIVVCNKQIEEKDYMFMLILDSDNKRYYINPETNKAEVLTFDRVFDYFK